MGSWAVLSFFFLWNLPVNTKVVDRFSNNDCLGFFYKNTEPSQFPSNNLERICQDWRDDRNPRRMARFPTLYDTFNRVPIWSAYYLATRSISSGQTTPSDWYIEPQLVNHALDSRMKKEGQIPEDQSGSLGSKQAMNIDYKDSYFDKGHLFPNSFQETNHRHSTFTLTNAVPMDPCFNRVKWAKLEKILKGKLIGRCMNIGGTPYLVTGSVPDQNRKIPVQDYDSAQTASSVERVSVPSHVWTAVCCDHLLDAMKFTLAFLGTNRDDGTIQSLTVEYLEQQLKILYGSLQNIKLFADSCGDVNQRTRKMISHEIEAEMMSGNIRIDMAAERKRKATEDLAQLSSPVSKVVEESSSTNLALQFNNYEHFLEYFESVPGFYCEVSSLGKVLRMPEVCIVKTGPICIVKERAPLPVPALGGGCTNDVCSNKRYDYSWCKTAQGWDYCCTEDCTYDEYSKSYKCQSSNYGKVPCSPQYSRVTGKGGTCRSDHPCARYGKDYYWCFIDYDDNWDYCCDPKPEVLPHVGVFVSPSKLDEFD